MQSSERKTCAARMKMTRDAEDEESKSRVKRISSPKSLMTPTCWHPARSSELVSTAN